MKTFKNINFTKLDPECTNIVACQAEQAPNANWVECDESCLHNLKPLHVQAGVRYFGYL